MSKGTSIDSGGLFNIASADYSGGCVNGSTQKSKRQGRSLLSLVAAICCLFQAFAASAQVAPVEHPDESAGGTQLVVPQTDDTDIATKPFVTFENHGYFRFRFNTLYNFDLGMAARGANDIWTPPTADSQGAKGSVGNVSDTATSANIRFRYAPLVRIGEILTVGGTFDFLDNLVLGQTPDIGSAGYPLAFQTRSQVWPSSGISGFKDSVRIKSMWADLYLFGVVHIMGGRMPEHFGLGIVRNGGYSLDSDFGDYVDGLFIKARVGPTYLRVGLEIVGQGVSSDSPFGYFVYPSDYSTMDDTLRWVFGADSTPGTPEEKAKQKRDLENHKPVVDWGIYNAITTQNLSSDRILTSNLELAGHDANADGYDYDKYTVVPRGAFFWTPSVWTKLKYSPRPGLQFRLEVELSMTYGWVDHMQSSVEDIDTSKDFLSFGGALEFDIDFGKNNVSFLTGAASGGNTLGYYGINDRHTLACPDNNCYSASNPEVFLTKNIHHFVFNRDYRIDSILFREIIGSVTNAFYFKPGYYRTFYKQGDWKVGGGVSLVASFACIKEGTPGGKLPLGVEPGLKLDATWRDILSLTADAAVLFPLSGMKYPNADDPSPASALRVRAQVVF